MVDSQAPISAPFEWLLGKPVILIMATEGFLQCPVEGFEFRSVQVSRHP